MGNLSCFCRARGWLFASFLLVFTSAAPLQNARAQTLDPGQLAAVLNIINSYLLNSGLFVDIRLDEVVSTNFGYQYGSSDNRQGLNIRFDGQSEAVNVCFNTEDIQEGEVSIFLNGDTTPLGNITPGENCIEIADQVPGKNILSLVHNAPGERWGVSNIGLEYVDQAPLGLDRVTRIGWDEAAVRKVLKIFAFGGHATDAQITLWANTNPELAIAEMLTFEEHNLKLSPLAPGEKYADPATNYGTLAGFSAYLSSNDSFLPIPLDPEGETRYRGRYVVGDDDDRDAAFVRMVTTRGLNPFRQRIGLWETNYHLAVNLDTSVDDRQLVKYYDVIMDAHESGVPYKDVIGAAAKSAAVARQYGHDRNRWVNNNCICNDDFAREIHQLFYGIFGDEDPENDPLVEGNDHHENVTIPQTARMLTDMPVNNVTIIDSEGMEREISGDTVTFGTSQHHVAPLDILNNSIVGANAEEKIDYLMDISMEHPEALKNLPVMIVAGLADDNLSDSSVNQLRAAWAAMGSNKNFLEFIRAYAISDMFHSPDQRKFFTTFERGLHMATRNYQTNTESLLDTLRFSGTFDDENAELFRPAHNVFGGQTSFEAADSPTIFEESYNRYTNDAGNRSSYFDRAIECDECDFGSPWSKDWGAVIPTTKGQYLAEDVARWLWVHVFGNLDNYGPTERAYLLPILGTWRLEADDINDHEQDFFDLNHLLCVREDILDDEGPAADVSLARMLDYDTNNGFLGYCTRDGGTFSQTNIDRLQRIYTADELENTPHIAVLLDEIGAMNLSLDSNVAETREFANQRIQWALAFIFTTPYIYAEETKQ